MEEAQYFADRIVVLSRGRLRCVGSWQFLRQQFSVGYLLNMTVKAGSSSDRLLRAVKSHMRGASLVRCDDTSVIIMLPLSQAARLSGLLKMLESKERGSEYLGITEFSLTMTSLEHVFWKMETEAVEKVAAEEEAGHVFISPLLTPPDDSFASCDDVRGNGSRRSSVFPPSDVPRIVTPSPLDDLSRRFSAFPAARQLGLDGNDNDSRRKSAFPRLQERDDVMGRQERKGSGHSAGSIGRRLSNIFTKSTPQNKRRRGSVDLLAPPSLHSPGSPNPSGVSRRATLFAEALLKRRKDGQRSPMAARIKKSNTSHTLHDLANSDRAVEESSAFSGGAVLPTSLAARRATVAAFKDFRRSISLQSNLSGLASVSEQPTMPSDPMSRLHVLDTYDRSRPPSISDISTFGGSAQLSTCSSMEEISFSPIEEAGKDPEKAPSPTHPAKIGEVLANMTAPKTGARLGLQRLGAMVRLRIWLMLRAKCWLLLRLVFPALFAGIGVGLAYLTQPLNPTPSQPGKRIHLFGISHLMYRNRTGGDISHLEADFSRTLDGPERMTHYSADSWDTGQPLESLLDVLQQDGDSYRLNYNATCALALPHMTSFLAHLMRHSPTPTPLNPHNQAYLGPQLSAWLQAWPPRSALRSERPWDWVPILFLGLALLLTTTHCAVRLVRERRDKLRSYLGVTGVSRLTYYGSAFIVDVIELLVAASFVIIVCAVSEVAMLEVKGAIESVALLMILSVPVTILTVYLASFAFSTMKTCRLLLPIVLILVTVALFCLVHFLDRGDTEELSTVLHYVFCVVWPPYLRFGTLHYIARAGDLGETSADVSPFQSHIDICYIMLFVDIVVLPCLVLLLDKLIFRTPTLSCCGRGRKKSSPVDHLQGDDEGVTSEIQRVQDLDKNMNKTSWPWLVLEAVSKVWSDNSSTGPGSRRFVKAVDNVSLTVDAGQLVAVLGPRGAGKTTLLGLVLGSNTPSDGLLHVDTEKVGAGQWKEGMGQTGYCPQYDPLWAPLTVDQHVLLMANLQGLHRQDLDSFRESLYYDLDLDSYQWQKVTQLSDCEKRKLSFAMSMLGRQSAMILDEPSFGMDPRSRRLYWDAVKHFLQCSERSGVVSTRSVEEATTLCSRLALVVNGRIQHLGTEEELKRRCRQTFSLEVRFRSWQEGSQPRMDMLLLLLKELFPSLTLVEQFHQRALFRVHLTASDLSLASTFDALDTVKRTLELEEFTFSQYTLDQLFLDLSRQQKQGDSKFLTLDELLPKPSSQHPHPTHLNPTTTTPDAPVGVGNTDPAQQPRDVKDEGGASCQDDVSDADAAVGMVVIHHYNGDDGGGGVACGEEGELQGAGAAAPVVFSLDGVDNLAFTTDGHDPPETQTSL